MAKPQTRQQLKEYCLRQLGAPVIEINVDDDQLEDRIDESIQLYNDYHYDGSEKVYLKHVITAEDITNEYLTVADETISVIRAFPIDTTAGSISMFDVRYQLRLNDMFDLSKQQLAGYTMAMQHLSLIENLFNQAPSFRFNRHTNRLYLDIDWSFEMKVGKFLLFETYRRLDPESYTDAYNDLWLKKYTTSLFKRQWGSNLSKFNGVVMLGGVTLNGEQVYQQAQDDIEKLEREVRESYDLPVDYMIG